MSLQFSVSKNGPPNNTNKINKSNLLSIRTLFVGKVLKGRPKLMKDFLFRLIEKKLTIYDTEDLHINDLLSTYNRRECNRRRLR